MQFSQVIPGLPFATQDVSEVFKSLHVRHIDRYARWSLAASRTKMIASFWLEILTRHFLPLFIIGWMIVFLFSSATLHSIFLVSIPAGLTVFICLLLTMYMPVYYLDFLPQLENCMEECRQDHLDGIQKCKKEQYPVLTLILIEQVSGELMAYSQDAISENYLQLLSRKFGVSRKMVESVLRITKLRQWDRKKIRKRTEIIDAFALAKDYFRQLSQPKAIIILESLEQKILC
jgi:hypothetical protein